MQSLTIKTLLILTFFGTTQFSGSAQTLLDVVIGTNNLPITEVQFTYDGSVITQTSGNPATVSTDKPVVMNYFEINDGDTTNIAFYNNFGTVVRNNNFASNVGGVGIYEQGAFILADDPVTFEPALERSINELDLLNFLYYDGTSNLPGGDDFDILFAKGIESEDYVVVGERNGNTYFVITPLDINGDPITTARKLRFGSVDGTNSGNGSARYDWNIGYAPTNYTTQPIMYTVVDAELFDTGGAPIFGFRIDNNGEADVKFFGLSGDSFEDNESNTNIGGLSGNVFNDANGLMNNIVDGTGINSPDATALHATLYDNVVDTVIATVPVASDGSFEFLDLPAFTDYGVRVSTNQGVPGAALPTINLPTNWVNTGEHLGASAGSDGVVNGDQSGLVVVESLVPEVNFGIEKRPEADSYSFVISAPVLDSYFTIGSGATSNLSGDDLEDGVFGTNDKFGITSLPTNGNELYYNGAQILLGEDGINPPSASNPFVIDNYNPSLLEIKFTGPGTTGTEFEYVTIDAADNTPSIPVVYELTYIGGLTGNVFNDADGLTDSTVDGTGINTPDGTALYATLYDNAVDTVIASIPVAADGSFEFLDLPAFADYGVLISTNQGVPGAALPTINLPKDWVNTGDHLGAGAGDDGTVDGNQAGLAVAQLLVTEVNFGIEKTPEADSYLYEISAPVLDSYFTIGSGATSDLSGDDFEDGVFGTNDKFGITSLPTNGNELYYNGTQIVLGEDGINPPSPSNPFVIDNYDPSLLEIRFTGPGTTGTQFEYITIDAADNTSAVAAVYELTYIGSLRGNVFNDADGLTDNTVDGTGINTPDGTALYATLYDGTVDTVIASIPVAADGSFAFLDIPAFADYGVLISTNQGVPGAALPTINLPTDWVNTGEHLGTSTGDDGSVDGNQTGLAVAQLIVPEVNFGIEKTPEADSYSYSIPDPQLDSLFTIGSGATSDLSGDDFEDGAVGSNDKFGITALPTNGHELYYDGSQIVFGQDGINPPSASNPFIISNYDPTLLEIKFTSVGSTSTYFEYITFDAADNTSPSAIYELTYSTVLPVEWAAFEVTKTGETASLMFATASERLSSHFIVQKSLDGLDFRDLGIIVGKGSSNYYTEYHFTDKALNTGMNYYRIAQVDIDGQVDYTEVKSVVFHKEQSTEIYPNPISYGAGSIGVKYYNAEESATITITSMLGTVVKTIHVTKFAGWDTAQIDIEGLTPGMYALRVGSKQKAVIFQGNRLISKQ